MSAEALHVRDEALIESLDPIPSVFEIPDGMRAAAVIAPVFRRADEDYVLVLRRRRDLRRHGGEIAFPGGRREPGETPIECALREMEEEVGIAGEDVQVLGALPAMPSLGGFHVHAMVGRIPSPARLWIDEGEIEQAIELPVRELVRASRWQMRIGPGARRESPHFEHGPDVLWGLTAWFVRQLLARAGLLAIGEHESLLHRLRGRR